MKRNRTWFLLGGCLLVLFFSCAFHQKTVNAYRETGRPVPQNWVVGDVSLEQRVPDRELEKKIPEILAMLGAKYGMRIIPAEKAITPEEDCAHLSLWIKEQGYNRSLDQYNSIAALLTLCSEDGEILLRTVYSEDTTESIKSFQRLLEVLDDILKATGQKAGIIR